MADLQKTISIIFATEHRGEQAFRDINKHVGTLDSSFGGLGGRVKNVTEDLLLVGAAVTAAATAFAVFAAKEAIEFESAQLDLQKVLSDSEGSVDQYTDSINELALRYGVSATDILQGTAEIKQAGFAVAEAFELQDVALKAAVISELDVIEATTLLTRSLKGYKAEVGDANRILDLFNEVSNKNATNVRELATGFSELSPIAQKLGLSYEETIALMTPIIEVFGSGAEAGNALKIAMTSLIVPTGAARAELERLGVAVEDSNGQLRSGRDITFETMAAISGLSDTQKIATLSILAGERQAARLSESLGNLSGVNKVLRDQTGATGSAMKEFNVRMQATEKVVDRLGVAWEIFLRQVGDPIIEELKPVFEDLLTSMTSLEAKALASEIGKAFASWISALSDFSRNINAIYGDIAGIKDASLLVDFAKWSGDAETTKTILTVVNTIVQGLAMGVALVHDGFAAVGNIAMSLYRILENALLTPILLANKAIEGLLAALNAIPGIDLAAPFERTKALSDAIWEKMGSNAISEAPFEYWSDNVAQSIAVVDAAIEGIGTTSQTMAAETTTALGEVEDATGDVTTATDENTEALDKKKDATVAAAKADDESAKAISKTVEELTKFKLGLEEIQSKERISIFKIQAEVDMAAIEASVDIFEASMDSIQAGFDSTSDTMLGLFELMGTASAVPFGSTLLMEAIEQEMQLRKQEFDLQKDLVTAQIDLENLRLQKLESGEALIKISADGLEPHIKAFMFEILDEIQIEANADAQQLLLGVA